MKRLEFWLRLAVKALQAGRALVREVKRLVEQLQQVL
jgi:hypothetical protein